MYQKNLQDILGHLLVLLFILSDIPNLKTVLDLGMSISIKCSQFPFINFISNLHSLCLCTATALTEQSVLTTQVFKKCGHIDKTSGETPGVIIFYDPGVLLHVYIRVHM